MKKVKKKFFVAISFGSAPLSRVGRETGDKNNFFLPYLFHHTPLSFPYRTESSMSCRALGISWSLPLCRPWFRGRGLGGPSEITCDRLALLKLIQNQ